MFLPTEYGSITLVEGLSEVPSNFGFAGDPPTHPELLDWLATELLQQNWQLKGLQKTILMSAAYQAASTPNEKAYAADSRNESFWRFDMRRLSAEEITRYGSCSQWCF